MRGQIGPPFDLTTSKFEMTYGADWQPQQLTVEGALRNETMNIGTSFGVTTATNEVVHGQRRGGVTHQISPRSIVLPVNYFGAYEALAARLVSYQAGTRVPVYVAPEGEITATIGSIVPRRISTANGTVDLQEYDLVLNRPGLPMSVQVLVDNKGRLARVVYRDAALAAIREEFANVMAREVRVPRPGDEEAFVPASGFSLGATVSRPQAGPGRLPAVILVGSAGRQDRDELLYGVPIFGYLAGALADAGYIVVRFDKRGVGQSGGRPEHAGLPEYANDVVGIVEWLRKRKDVDPERIAVLTHGEGSAIGLTAAGRDKKIRALGLLAAPGVTGREVVLGQQQRALDRRNEPEADKQARIALQRRVIDAVVTGKGWEELPPDIRRQADTPWFKSWLTFDPAAAMRRVTQPVLVLNGELDWQMPPAQGDKVAQASAARKGVPATHTSRVAVPGVNHLLVTATTGDLDAVGPAPARALAPEVVSAVVNWLSTALPRK
jgi:pimeloyl-ACP methyl ester carboxylesterase